ncbi:RIP metalloprotease RseP [Tabrizicola oligotrophica]|uniref:Zinc metalloprotease n=1 Tax=Tabrizicola oligotrophica TaxID=2710650 RepID=A0A6M0QPT1_9RHOB|nr:RIP metalloprotease RseP [Tabrizicola oligotrophica]NEY88744.1 RIP metalloprotease RseP [Tabrizicola oligotrophica]
MDFLTTILGTGGLMWTLVFFILALGIIVFVHEYGHYIVGRLAGIHAEVFSLGLGPVLFSRFDQRGTRWQIALIPIGGYVKFLGDADAASGRDAHLIASLTDEERRHTMHGAPLWARTATVAAGPVFNFLLAIAVYWGLILWSGVATDRPVVGTVATLPGLADTLRPGDEVLALNGTPTPDLESYLTVARDLPAAALVRYLILRDGAQTEVSAPHPMPPLVASVQLKSAALAAGLQSGDVILAAAGKPVTAFSELPPIVEGLAGAPVPLTIWRADGSAAGQTFDLTITPNRRDIPKAEGGFETRWLIGLSGGLVFEPEVRQPGVFEALSLAVQNGWFAATTSLSGLWHVITGAISSCNISGPIGMAQVMGQAATLGAEYYITMLAVMSLGIGLINLFPIPVLDGGHLVFHAYEAVMRRPPPEGVLRVLMTIGLFVVITFMAYALRNDVTCG